MISFTSSRPTGAAPRKLCERELHRELRRADTIIANAHRHLTPAQKLVVAYEQSHQGLTPLDDPQGIESRKAALNRTESRPDIIKIMLVVISLILGMAWYAAQTDNDLLRAELQQATKITYQ